MLTFLLRRLIYGLTVLFGVVTLVFFLFTLVPDPARELAGQSESEEVVEAIRKKFSLDLPAGKRYLLFLNDVSVISIYSNDAESRLWRSEAEVGGMNVANFGDRRLVLKKPYLGRSWLSGRGVSGILGDALPGTFLLAALAMFFALLLGIFFGIIAALNKDSALDRFLLVIASIGMSGPSFFMAILFAWLFGYLWHSSIGLSWWLLIFPLMAGMAQIIRRRRGKSSVSFVWYAVMFVMGGVVWYIGSAVNGIPALGFQLPGTGLPMTGSLYTVDVWEGQRLAPMHILLPALTLGIRPLAVVTQLMRNSVLEVLGQDYIRSARAKGLTEFKVITRHVVRNAMNPVITAASGWLASMLAGAVFVEYVFGWKGLGMEVFRSLEKNDLPVVMGAVIVIAAVFVVINTLVDILYGWIDPRVRLA